MATASSSSSTHAIDDAPPTRTVTSISIVHARPEHLQAIHDIQLICYKDHPSFHESLEVFRSKLDHYPPGNFVALATYSVVTDQRDPGQLWTDADKEPSDMNEDSMGDLDDTDVAMEEEQEEEGAQVEEVQEGAGGGGADRRGSSSSSVDSAPSSTVEIIITEEDDADTNLPPPDTTGSASEPVPIVRARTPDISTPLSEEEDNNDDKAWSAKSKGETPPASASAKGKGVASTDSKTKADHRTTKEEQKDEEDEDPVISILAQWEQPIGYLISHPFHRETATLHKIAPSATVYKKSSTAQSKKARLDHKGVSAAIGANREEEAKEEDLTALHKSTPESSTGAGGGDDDDDNNDTATIEEMSDVDGQKDTEGDTDDERYEHDPLAEKYFLHDMAILPEYQSQGLAYLLFQALEQSLTPPSPSLPPSSPKPTHTSTSMSTSTKNVVTTTLRSGCTVTMPHRWNRRGAPNVKELHLVSVQGSHPFWSNRPAFHVCHDHDLDLSAYGEDALYMTRPFRC
ncbi:hypothetical protein BGZ73_001316 [Actinomortierella ambigua]|nr:hypothetical protein BGZ73_001316 [Actinomortierella ambigua]